MFKIDLARLLCYFNKVGDSMNQKVLMKDFITLIENKNLMTLFISNMFDYQNLQSYNYLFRMKEERDSLILDIYDNISSNRFNRYIFSWQEGEYDIKVTEDNNVFVTYIHIKNVSNDSNNKLLKFAYLFNIEKDEMIKYASTFLDPDLVKILKQVTEKEVTHS